MVMKNGGGGGNRTHGTARRYDNQKPNKSTTEHTQILELSGTCAKGGSGRKNRSDTSFGQRCDSSLRSECAICVSQPDVPPELKCVADAWPDIPEPIRAAIVAMVRSVTGEEQ